MKKLKLYLWLLAVNLFISAFTFGGGYVVVPMIRKYFVRKRNLFTEEELMEMAAIAQSSPGAIAINLSALAGKRAGGYPGAVLSAVSAVIPPILILSLVSMWYDAFAANQVIAAILKGMSAGVAALIVDLIVDMYRIIRKEGSVFLNLLAPGAFIASYIFQVNVALVLVVCSLLCIFQVYKRRRPSC